MGIVSSQEAKETDRTCQQTTSPKEAAQEETHP